MKRWKRSGRICPICGKHQSEFGEYATLRNWNIDHIVPLSKGGTNQASNLRITCAQCNHSKGSKG